MTIFRTSLGNVLDVTITVTGDGNTWTNEQLDAWSKVVAACMMLKEAHRPKPPTPEEVLAKVNAEHYPEYDGFSQDDSWHCHCNKSTYGGQPYKHRVQAEVHVAQEQIKALTEANLLIVGTGAKVDKPSPPTSSYAYTPMYYHATEREAEARQTEREERDRS